MKFKFNTKLILSFSSILIVTILSMGVVANYLLTQSAYSLGTNLSKGIVESTTNMIDSKVHSQTTEVKRGMEALESRFYSGLPPEMIVKELHTKYKLYTTIFKREGQDYVRVATSIPTRDGSSALGTKLSRESEAYAAASQGKTWSGIRDLLGYITMVEYKPLDNDTILYVGIPLIDEDLVEFLEEQHVVGKGYIYLLDQDGTFAWHPNDKVSGSSVTRFPFADDLMNAHNELVSYVYKGDVKHAYVGTDEETGLRIAFGLTGDELMFDLDKDIHNAALFGGLTALLISSIIAFFAIRYIRSVLGKVEGMAISVAEGDYDAKDDYGADDNIRRMLDAMEGMAVTIKDQIRDVEEKSEEAMVAKSESEAALNQVKEAQESIERKNARILEAATEAKGVSEAMASTATELSAQFTQVSQGAEDQRIRVTEMATAIEEMTAAVLSVARNAGDASLQAEDSNGKANDGMSIMGQTIESISSVQSIDEVSNIAMKELSDKADAVGNIVSVIEDIADQTNLLALNAAIEAARAGDAGRGFAVVADEVRKLAEKTMTATQEVGSSINEIQSAVAKNASERDRAQVALNQTVESAQQVSVILKEIVDAVSQSSSMSSEIAAATEEQSVTTEQIRDNVDDVDRISGETASAMHESMRVIDELAGLAAELDRVMSSLTD